MNDLSHAPWMALGTYSVMILLASLAGGWIPLQVRLTHTRLQVTISFVAGLMLGVGVLHLLPHAWHQHRSIDSAALWLLAGFLGMFFIQRFFHFHHHDVTEESPEMHDSPATDAHPHPLHDHGHCNHSLAEHSARRLSWAGAALGMTLHALIEGFALAASVHTQTGFSAHGWSLGLSTFLVIVLHKPFDSMAITTLMARSGGSKSLAHWVNALFALVVPAGVLLFHFGAGQLGGDSGRFMGAALAFAAGTFLCIAASDLLPELQFHAHDRIKLSLALVAGLGLAALLGHFETAGHDNSVVPAQIRPEPTPPSP